MKNAEKLAELDGIIVAPDLVIEELKENTRYQVCKKTISHFLVFV